MIHNPRFWLSVAGLWLIAAGCAHTAMHVWTFVLENGIGGLREFAVNAMKQAQSPDPLMPSMWRQFRMYSVSFGLLLFLAGSINLLFARTDIPRRFQANVALLGTVLWTIAFIPYAFVDPVIQSIVVAFIAVPLHAIAYLTATLAEEH